MKNGVLPLAAALALSLSSCAESFAPHRTNKELVGKVVTIYFGPNDYLIGTLLPDGRLGNDKGVPRIINWDHVHRVN